MDHLQRHHTKEPGQLNYSEENIVELGRALFFDRKEFERKVYELWD